MMETFIRYNVFGIASSFFILSVTDEQADKLNSFVDAMQEEQECDKYLSSKMLRMGSASYAVYNRDKASFYGCKT